MKKLILLVVLLFSVSVFADPDSPVRPGFGPDEVETEFPGERGDGSGRPDFDDLGRSWDSGSPWGDAYGDRDGGSAMIKSSMSLKELFSCSSLFVVFAS